MMEDTVSYARSISLAQNNQTQPNILKDGLILDNNKSLILSIESEIIFIHYTRHTYFKILAIVTIIVAIDAADVPIAAYSAVVILFFCFFDGTTIVHPGWTAFLLE